MCRYEKQHSQLGQHLEKCYDIHLKDSRFFFLRDDKGNLITKVKSKKKT